MNSGIYLLKFKDFYYVGSTKNFEKRLARHLKGLQNNKHHNIILQRAFNKYKEDIIEFSILEEIEYTKDLILEKEQYYIEKFKKDYDNKCCNLSGASFGDTKTNHPRKEEIIEQMRTTIQKNMDGMSIEERKEKFGLAGEKNGMYNRKHSDTSKEKMSAHAKQNVGNKNGFFGKTHSIENKEKFSKYAKQKIGNKNSFYGKQHTEETKNKIREKNKNLKPVNMIKIQIDDKIYESYGDASKCLGIGITTIRWRCLSSNEKFKDYQCLP